MSSDPHLVVLRGNSASGKTTVAAAVQRALGPGTANISQDHLRRVVLREHDVADGDNIGLLANTIRYCAGIGYDVIVEGILVASHYRDMLCEVITEHRGSSHVFYLDVTLEESLLRHQASALGREVTAEEFRRWFTPLDLLGIPGEVVLDASASVNVTVGVIVAALGDTGGSEDWDKSRFLQESFPEGAETTAHAAVRADASADFRTFDLGHTAG